MTEESKFRSLEALPTRNQAADESAGAVFEQLRRIQDSHSFCNSTRSKEFLSYVVEHGLKGNEEMLKERSIGINLFHRNPDYITSDDPIVRVKAAEVRRRLTQFYAEEEETPEVRIEIPVGSYIPKFHWKQPSPSAQMTAGVEQEEPAPAAKKHFWRLAVMGPLAALIVFGSVAAIFVRAHFHRPSALDLFWGPLSATKQPILICVPTPVSYALNSSLYQQSPMARSGIYSSLSKRNATALQLDPETSLKWKDLTPLTDFYINKDDAYAAEALSVFFTAQNRSNQLRLGNDYTYEDLRSSPAVLVGAYNNPWIDRVMSDLPIGFRESGEILWIEDRTKAGQVWKASTDGRLGTKDFALVARLLNSKTGQFLVIVSGVGMVGTKAAGGFISNEQALIAALRTAPDGWEKKNLEVVLETDIVESSPSPSHAVAVKVW